MTATHTHSHIHTHHQKHPKHQGVEYEEAGRTTKEEAESITFAGEVDRVYGPAPAEICMEDRHTGRLVTINKDGGFPGVYL